MLIHLAPETYLSFDGSNILGSIRILFPHLKKSEKNLNCMTFCVLFLFFLIDFKLLRVTLFMNFTSLTNNNNNINAIDKNVTSFTHFYLGKDKKVNKRNCCVYTQ